MQTGVAQRLRKENEQLRETMSDPTSWPLIVRVAASGVRVVADSV
ncbi:hypothetical protein OCH239_15015 [Roseivivax halodurans JCM 10272]|uniref:Uncharacterized protein n=1 Tax=Roseivivax halodurans JCM 10272 TaxID=1449350 RepID=X7EA80_9RHOB|nr:hypothetical protein OCH239_15015 [Roseivivax halodurans JCM 10272]